MRFRWQRQRVRALVGPRTAHRRETRTRMTSHAIAWPLGIATLLAASAATSHAATLCVNPAGTGPCRSTIQAAVNAAEPGDVVTIFPGTYFESVDVPGGKDGLLISGTSALAVTLDPDLP